jgi:hypothetical protein
VKDQGNLRDDKITTQEKRLDDLSQRHRTGEPRETAQSPAWDQNASKNRNNGDARASGTSLASRRDAEPTTELRAEVMPRGRTREG